MIKPIKLLFIVIFVFCGSGLFAQAHNSGPGTACKYSRPRCVNSEGCPVCVACEKERDEEKKAIKEENDKRAVENQKKNEAEQAARKVAFEKQQAKARAEAAHPKVVVLSMPDPPKAPTAKPIVANNSKNTYMLGNLDGRTKKELIPTDIFNSNFYAYNLYPLQYGSFSENGFPADRCIVTVRSEEIDSYHSLYAKDFVNVNGQRLFNDKTIAEIDHCFGDWFLVYYDPLVGYTYLNIKFYNNKTNSFIAIPYEGNHHSSLIAPMYGNNGTSGDVLRNVCYRSGKYLDGSFDFVSGKIDPLPVFSGLAKLMNDLTGGPKMWKAAFSVEINLERWGNDKRIYYIDDKDQIKSVVVNVKTWETARDR
jgi:hypothetical protein